MQYSQVSSPTNQEQAMAHLNTCRTYKELTGNIWTHYSDPDPQCTDTSHTSYYTQETK